MTNETKQTAVEWLINSLNSYDKVKEMFDCFEHEIKQAKEMEKQMTIKLYNDYENYLEETFKNQCGGQAVVLSFEEFYEQTYGGNK
jgi:arginine utilization protein RocB